VEFLTRRAAQGTKLTVRQRTGRRPRRGAVRFSDKLRLMCAPTIALTTDPSNAPSDEPRSRPSARSGFMIVEPGLDLLATGGKRV
jgi:hypothetical protein